MSAEPVARPRLVLNGRHQYLLDGEVIDGVTTITKRITDQLVNWKGKDTADYAVNHWDDLSALPVADRVAALHRHVFERAAATRGTSIHELLMRLARGEELEHVPDDLDSHVQTYLRFADQWKVQDELVEVRVVTMRDSRFDRDGLFPYAGTLDLVARLADGRRWLLDFKTGRDVYPEVVLQLAAYRYAEFYVGIDGDLHPMPEVDACGVVWLRADGYDLLPCVADERALRTFRYAQQVARFHKREREEVIGRALVVPEVAA